MDFESKYQSHLKKYTKSGISRLLEMAGQKKFLLYISSIFAVIASVVSLIPYISVYKILEVLLRNYVFYSSDSRQSEDMEKDGDIMIKWGIISVIAFSVYIVFQGISLIFSHVAAFNILYNIRVQIAEHIGFLPLGYLSNTTTGAISKTLEENVESIEIFIAHNIPDIVIVFATCIFSLIVFFHYNFTLTIVCLVVFIMALGAQFTGMFSKRSKEITVLFYDVSEKISGSVVQFIYGIPVVKIFGKTVFSFRKLADDLKKYRDLSVECCYLYCPGMCLSIALIESFCAFIIPIGLLLLSRNEKDLALALDYIFFIIMSPGLASPLFNLIMMSSQLVVINEGNKRIDAILNEDIIKQPENPKIPTKFNVTFKDVTFNYRASDKKKSRTADNEDVLSHVSFEAENGKITALVGPSGSGKSTIGSLIPRFWDVEEGEVCIGGVNVKDITYPNLMNIISFVFQDTFLFNDTVYNNIAVGRLNATKNEVIAAAKAAQCHEFIEALPKKYDTIIGSVEDKEGLLLSGGEQQRICIARAILKNSPILVLDEATAYSDPENEYNIQLALKELIKDKTVIVIAHNLNTIKSADNIIVVKKGKIVEQGKHDYLLSLENGLYHSMWEAYIHSSKWYITNKLNPNQSKDQIDNHRTNDNDNDNDNDNVSNPFSSDSDCESLKSNHELMKTKDKDITNACPPQKPKKLYKEGGVISDNFNILYNVSCGNPKKLYPAIFYTALANFVNVLPFCLTIYVVQTVFESFDGSGTPLNKTKIWIISGILLVYILFMYAAQLPAFHNSYTKAYESSVSGRMRLAEHIRKLPVGTIYAKDPGEMVSLLMNDFQTIETCSSHMIPQLFGALVMPVFAFISLLFVDWRLDLAAFLPFSIGLSVLIFATSLQNKVSLQQLFAKVEAGSSFKEYLKGIRCIKAYNLIGTKFDRLQSAFYKLMMESIKIEVILGPIVSLSNTITHTGIFFMIIVGAYLLKNNDVKITTFVMFLVIGSRIFDPLVKSIGSIAAVRYSAVAGKRILKFLDLPIMEGKTSDVNYGPKKDIVFKDVNFKYRNEDNEKSSKTRHTDTKKEKIYDLQNINLTMKQGTLTALVGPSGSGKTTILKLISKFYDVDSGKITYAGEDISKIDPEFYMKNISIVFQDVYLFQDTIANNIRFGREDASMEDVIEVAKKACAHDFIVNLPNGYDTMVGEGGCTLSGGEKQRISIARAILKDSPVVLLDEATSSLDPENEVEVQKAISELIVGRTVIVISHHLKIITEADNIVVLEEGCIVEQGTHQQLLSNNSVYKRLWDIQEKYKGWTMN